MNPVIEQRRQELVELCRRFRARRLGVFGSAATDRFDPQRSDLDFLVEYQPLAFGESADCYFGLRAWLEDLFGRPIDVVQPEAIRNPYFLRGIQGTRTLVYEHRDEEVPV